MEPSPRRKLPIGIQTLATLREQGAYYYVDKTGFALDLVERGSYYFLSRPRRFGKSLFLDTLKEMFEANQPLFTGLQAETRWDWSRAHPVIRLSFGAGVLKSGQDLNDALHKALFTHEERFGLPARFVDARSRLADLIERLHALRGAKVVVLIDEYDKPILDNIADRAAAAAMREGLKNIYSVLKDADQHLRFVFITGVTKFSKVSLFSGLNNLRDITLDARYSALCGYTDADVDTVFGAELRGLDRDEMRRWYNGYNWLGERVYSPFDLLLFFDTRHFDSHWFETGTSTFLIELLLHSRVFTPDLDRAVAPETLLSTFDVDHIPVEALMFQTGYLTVDHVERLPGLTQVTLRYPNLSVRTALNGVLLQRLMHSDTQYGLNASNLYKRLLADDLPGLRALFEAFFATIPHDWYRNSPIAGYEGYWASVFYSHFAALGLDIRLEDSTSRGCIDMTVFCAGRIWLFEFKVVELMPAGRALQQIKDRGYAEKYRGRGEPLRLIGVEFSKNSRNIVGFETERVPAG